MPKIERNIFPDSIHHVYNRAIDKRTIFYTDNDYNRFIDKMFLYERKYKVKIIAFSILPNHFHLLLQEPTPGVADSRSQIEKFVSCLCISYSKYFNLIHERSGPLFQSRFKSKLIDSDEYLGELIYYIDFNALRHKVVKDINNWPYTSYHDRSTPGVV